MPQNKSSGDIRILVVDDEETIRNLLCEKLVEMGYRCETARDGKECITKFEDKSGYDVVLLDIQMPNMNGIETLKKLKSHDPDVSVIIISASRDIEDVRSALKLGAYDFIFKPFNIIDVESVLERAVERSNLLKQNRDYQQNLERKVVEQTTELVKLYAGTLEAMVRALDLREKETGFHSYRVTEYSVTLARKMDIQDDEVSVIAKGALLHDIGKIGVPDNILLKPGKLTDEEWEIMKKHPQLGYDMLKNIDFLEDAAKIVLHHHEHYDGKGYPHGLAGKDIPAGARIFSVVDALDAMTSDRVYRKAFTFEKAFEIIGSVSGSQFDPDIVNGLLEIGIDEFMEIRKSIDESGADFLRNLMFDLTRQ